MNNMRFGKNIASILLLSVLAVACVPQSKIKYLQQLEKTANTSEFPQQVQAYKLQKGDYLYIRILTLDEKINGVFDNITGSQSSYGSMGEQNLYLTSYMVNDSGFVAFPVIGKVKAAGLTVAEVEKNLYTTVNEIIKEASVVVKLVQFNISILGEVKSPGKFPVYKDKITVFEALSLAGDLTTFSNRKKVHIIRNENSTNKVYTINLLDINLLSSPLYYLQPNDIVYIEPLENKQFAFESFPYTLIFSTITTALVIVTFFKK